MSNNLDYLNRVYLKIDLDKICNNTKEVMKRVGKDTKVMAVVKADAYGHGAIEVSKALSEIGTYVRKLSLLSIIAGCDRRRGSCAQTSRNHKADTYP